MPAQKSRRHVGACWPFIQAKFSQFIYGFYPEPERWRVNLTFLIAAILLVPLLIPRLPAKGPNAILFFLAFPVVAFFLLRGGGLGGFGVSWTAGLLSGFIDSIGDRWQASSWHRVTRRPSSERCRGCIGKRSCCGLGAAYIAAAADLAGRVQIQASGYPVWADLARPP